MPQRTCRAMTLQLLLCSIVGCCVAHDLLVSTVQGPVHGRYVSLPNKERVRAFLGIPYAELPTARHRFKEPIPKKKWTGTLNATAFGPLCYQPVAQTVWDTEENELGKKSLQLKRLKEFAMSEDCLTVNIYTPIINAQEEPLTVMVYFHGGSYYINGGRLYPAEKLASLGMIIVTFNYRLGSLGFLSTEDGAATGNYGLLDQVLVLKWVQDNIAAFGGNPSNVTIFGNSAGGASVSFHMLSPLSKGLFTTAIVQSGCATAPWAIQHKPLAVARELAQNLDCPTESSQDLVDCLREQPADLLVKKSTIPDGFDIPFAPSIDGPSGGHFLPKHPLILLQDGDFHGAKIPFISGVTKHEVSIWFLQDGPMTNIESMRSYMQDRAKELIQNENATDANLSAVTHAIFVQYLSKRGISSKSGQCQTTVLVDFLSDAGIKAPCLQFLQALVNSSSAPRYMYEFDYFSSDDVKSGRQQWIGAYHESELQFVFGEPFLQYSNSLRSPNDLKISETMMQLWMNFARYGDPTPNAHNPLNIKWDSYTNERHTYLRILNESVMDDDYMTETMMFWNTFIPILTDYPIAGLNHDCHSQRKWVLLITAPIICLQTFLCGVLCWYVFHKQRHNARSSSFSPENITAV